MEVSAYISKDWKVNKLLNSNRQVFFNANYSSKLKINSIFVLKIKYVVCNVPHGGAVETEQRAWPSPRSWI